MYISSNNLSIYIYRNWFVCINRNLPLVKIGYKFNCAFIVIVIIGFVIKDNMYLTATIDGIGCYCCFCNNISIAVCNIKCLRC